MSSHRIMGANSVEAVRDSERLFNTSSHENMCPPAYSDAPSAADVSQRCCAYDEAIEDNLRRYQSFDFMVRDLSGYRCIVQESRRLLFLYWVAYCLGSSVSALEAGRLRCPLLRCREVFYDHKELVDHVGICPRLVRGEYYCPYHKREERFAEPTTVEIAAFTSYTSRKHFLKGAINFIRRGSRSIRNAIHPMKSTTQRQVSVSTQQPAQNEITYDREMSKFMARANTPELDGHEFTPMIPRTTASYIPELPSVSQRFEMEAATPARAELDSPSCPSMEWSPTTSTSESVSSPISLVSPVDGPSIRSFEDTWSPVSPTDTINPFSDFGSPMQLIKPQTSTVYQKGPTSSHEVYELPVPTTFGTITAFMLPNSQEHIYAPIYEIAAVRHRAEQRMLEYNSIAQSTGLIGIYSTSGVVEHSDARDGNAHELFPQDFGFDEVATTSTNELGQNQILKELVIDKLAALEEFRLMTIDAEKLLHAPRLVSPEELQMALVNNTMLRAVSPQVLETFTMLVNQFCEMAELALYVEQAVGEDYDMHKHEPLQHGHSSTEQYDYSYTDQQSSSYSSFQTPITPGLPELPEALVSPRMFARNIVMSPGTYSEIEPGFSSQQTIDLHTTHRNIPDLPELADNSIDDHPNANPSRQPQPAAVDPSSTTFAPGRGSLTCNSCKQVLIGKLEWLPSNLQRHVREKHTPGGGRRHPCTVAGCPKDFSRKSNLQVHLNTVHKGLSGR